jgi:hypothetical protein
VSAGRTSEGGGGALANPPGARVTSIGTLYTGGSRLHSSLSGVGFTSAAVAANQSLYYKYWWPYNWVPSLIGIEVTAVVASAKLKLALYQLNADESIGARIGVTGDLDGATLGMKSAAIAPGSLWYGPGFYVFGFNTDSAISVRWHASAAAMWPYRATTIGPIAQLQQAIAYASGLPSPGPAMSGLLGSSTTHVFGLLGAP